MKNHFFLLIFSVIIFSCQNKNQETPSKLSIDTNTKEVLLIGTFHYNNPGADIAKTKSFDILSNKSQLELEQIALSIKDYNPTKIFVEWPYDEQKELDSLYKLYTKNLYFTNESLSDFYRKNEIFQLAFKVAKENDIEIVYGIDYNETKFPFEEVMSDIEKNNQTELKAKIEDDISKFTTEFDDKIDSGISLSALTYHLNSPEFRYFTNNFHNNTLPLAGKPNDFSGSLLSAEWYKRNIYMWSLIKKNTLESDERIMVLVGAGHAAMFELFIKENKNWGIKELKEIMMGK